MIDLDGVVRRSYTGPCFDEQEFDLNVFVPALRSVLAKYGIKYTGQPLPADDDLADRVFAAGIELYEKVGTYCVDTGRVIRFSRDEIAEALRNAPSKAVFGEGDNQKALVSRAPESPERPWCFLGAGGAAVSDERKFFALVRGYAKIPDIDSLTAPSLANVDGHLVRGYSPLEIEACIRSVRLAREATAAAGKPGLPIMNSIATAASAAGKIAGSSFGLRPSDGWLIGSRVELKVDFERLCEVAYVRRLGGHVVAETAPVLGGYAGGPEGVAVTNVAYHVHCIMVLQGSCQLTFPFHSTLQCTSSPDVMWAVSISTQAITRNSHFPYLNLVYVASGPLTRQCLYEVASVTLNAVVSGGGLEALGVARATEVDHMTPVEPRFAAAVALAASGMKRDEARPIVGELISRYGGNLKHAPKGSPFHLAWDAKEDKPVAEYEDLVGSVSEELREMGVRLGALRW